MKRAKIPRPIKAYFVLFGLFMGQLIGMACFLGATHLWGFGAFAIAWFVVTFGLYGVWMTIAFKYKRELADWGIIEGKKKDATTN